MVFKLRLIKKIDDIYRLNYGTYLWGKFFNASLIRDPDGKCLMDRKKEVGITVRFIAISLSCFPAIYANATHI